MLAAFYHIVPKSGQLLAPLAIEGAVRGRGCLKGANSKQSLGITP